MTTALARRRARHRDHRPGPPGATTFLKFGRREANTPAVVTVAAHLVTDDGVGQRRPPRPRRGRAAPAARSVREAALAAAADEDTITRRRAGRVDDVEPLTDAVASDWYRRRMVGVVVAGRSSGLAAQAREGRVDGTERRHASSLGEREVEVLARRSTTLQAVLRTQLGHTSVKDGCRQGGCGSCTVLVDGEPMLSCLLPVEDVDGRRVTTLEGLTPAEGLHPVQRAFLEANGFQCGYCTPGMEMLAVGAPRPQPVARAATRSCEALSGNVCRCTGYEPIVDAIGPRPRRRRR